MIWGACPVDVDQSVADESSELLMPNRALA